jgi:vacuolar-type H+-ATPase catalytic subunit A/Vma1
MAKIAKENQIEATIYTKGYLERERKRDVCIMSSMLALWSSVLIEILEITETVLGHRASLYFVVCL